MNFSNILSHIAEADPEVYERTSQRRHVIRNWMRGISMAALPFALGSMFKKAYGRNTDAVHDALNFALTLEYLEHEFYTIAIEASVPPYASDPLIPSGLEQSAILAIRNHEFRHVEFLRTVINTLGGTVVAKPRFDFTGGKGTPNGNFSEVFTDYDVFLSLAQTFEDTGVRAYKAGAPIVMANNDLLTALLRIQSVEARHAAHIRRMRRNTPSDQTTGIIKPWVTGMESNINSPDVQKSYTGDDNTLQANIQITDINGQQVNFRAASESFDEPLTVKEVLEIVDPFIIPE